MSDRDWDSIWQSRTANFRIEWCIAPEDDPDYSWDETGETAENVASGLWTCFTSRVTVVYLPTMQTLGTSYLGNSIYEKPSEFRDHIGAQGKHGSYFVDMVREACAESRRMLSKLQGIHIRAGA